MEDLTRSLRTSSCDSSSLNGCGCNGCDCCYRCQDCCHPEWQDGTVNAKGVLVVAAAVVVVFWKGFFLVVVVEEEASAAAALALEVGRVFSSRIQRSLKVLLSRKTSPVRSGCHSSISLVKNRNYIGIRSERWRRRTGLVVSRRSCVKGVVVVVDVAYYCQLVQAGEDYEKAGQ